MNILLIINEKKILPPFFSVKEMDAGIYFFVLKYALPFLGKTLHTYPHKMYAQMRIAA
jgi:hypothetical protein